MGFKSAVFDPAVFALKLRPEEPLRKSFVGWSTGQQRNTIMDREHVKGAADKAKGAIKEGAGKLTGDKDMETEGEIDKAKGSAHNAAGDVKDAARDAADTLKK
ncbi:CsbD family protein [Bradyrhizobium sp. SHOUNA76]|uniref:CsbD family protein n=1 Tax=Bradyrhizobium sp. SHOUNA76 TaxID=2908927 RepID=UPI003857B626